MKSERLKYIADVRVSNVDKKTVVGDPLVRLCNYTDVYYNERITGELSFMSATASRSQLASFGLQAGDVVLTKDSETADDIGVSALVAEKVTDLVCGYHLAVVRANPDRVDGGYLRWVLASSLVRQRMSASATGVTRFGLRAEAIADLPIPVLSRSGQKALSRFLDRETMAIDALIAAKERTARLLGERRESLVAEFVSQATATCRPIPLWAIMRPEETTGAPTLEVLSVYRDHGIVPKSSRSDNHNKTPADLSRYQVVRPTDVVVNKMKAWQGSVGVSQFHGIVSPDYLVCKVSHPVNPIYLHQLLRSPQLRGEFQMRSEGIRPAQWRLQWDQMRLIKVPVPDTETQVKLVEKHTKQAASLQAMAATLDRQTELLHERRQALITAAVTGQIDIPEAA